MDKFLGFRRSSSIEMFNSSKSISNVMDIKARPDEHFFTDLCANCITLVGPEVSMTFFNQ